MAELGRYGNWALITGAASGLGREFARQIASNKINCVLVDINRGGVEELAHELGQHHSIETRAIKADLAAVGFVEDLMPHIDDLKIGLLVNNAGINCGGAVASRDPEAMSKLIRINCLAPVLLTRSMLPGMLDRQQGAIIFVSSLQAFISSPYEATYCASKAFNLHFGESLWGELRKKPVDCITVCPGGMKTDFFRAGGFSDEDCDRIRRYSKEPADIASLALRNLGKKAVVSPKMTLAVSLLSRLLPRQLITRGSEKFARKLVTYQRN